MGIVAIERAILQEARTVFKNAKLQKKHLLEWSTSLVKEQEGEVAVFLPIIGVWVAVPRECDRRE